MGVSDGMWESHLPESPRLGADDVHLWRWPLTQLNDDIAALKQLLAPDEIARAERFYYERHHDAFVAARAGLRNTLSRYLGAPPERVAFRYGDAGKPEVRDELATGDFAFNLSHSGDWAVCAVARRGPLGVDIERVRMMSDAAGLAHRYFAAAEVAVWQTLAPDEQTAAFFRCWTRKEAYLKALGDGLRAPLDRFVVSFAPGDCPRLIEPSPHDEHRDWTIENVEVAAGYIAAVVVRARCSVTRRYGAG